MTKNLDEEGLKSIVDQYDLFFIDLWGVIHNGIKPYEESIKVLEKLHEGRKEYVLLTNAPRPNYNVEDFLNRMGLEKKFYSKVYTSGEAALDYLVSNFVDKTFFHLGPPRDFGLFNNFKKNKIQNIEEADYLICTGLFDEYDKELSFYKTLLKKEVIFDFFCSLYSKFFLLRIFKTDGNKVKVTDIETNNPTVIIHPKSIIGLIPLKINDRKAHIVVRTV